MQKVISLIILGPQGSGKGTQARLLADRLNLVVIDAGGVLREMAKEDSELGQAIHSTINVRGELVPPELIAQVIQTQLAKISREQGVIVDGFPRNMKQYELLQAFWSKLGRADYQAILIDLALEDSIARLSTRVTCELCGSVYIAGQYETCQKCGGQLVQRPDDQPEAIVKRLGIFNAETMPVIAEFQKASRLVRVDGSPSIETVHEDILHKLQLGK
ncbi:MAG: Adenylate kinase [Parcubacteria group bacterium GW2011_GWA2_51_12]|nr:MAG: Adenylate kinase [Parcubacteria group bacterium GW2011_GWA2_51_12]